MDVRWTLKQRCVPPGYWFGNLFRNFSFQGRFKYKSDGKFLYRDGNIRFRKLKFKGNETSSGLEAIGLFDKDTSKITMNFSQLCKKIFRISSFLNKLLEIVLHTTRPIPRTIGLIHFFWIWLLKNVKFLPIFCPYIFACKRQSLAHKNFCRA